MIKLLLIIMLFCGLLHSATPENFSIRLEQVPRTHDVLVVGSWDVPVQAWSWGVCFDPETVNQCQERFWQDCQNIGLTDDLLTRSCGSSPEFVSFGIHQNGVTQGIILDWHLCLYEATERFEFVKISFDLVAEEADLAFCDTLGDPPNPTCVVQSGNSIDFGVQEGLTLYNRKYIRGDTNTDGDINIADAIVVLTLLFRDRDHVNCHAACDANDDGVLDLSDFITILNYLFLDADDLPEPFTQCGFDPTKSHPQLDCVSYEPCR